jgi:hypothetical protein
MTVTLSNFIKAFIEIHIQQAFKSLVLFTIMLYVVLLRPKILGSEDKTLTTSDLMTRLLSYLEPPLVNSLMIVLAAISLQQV